MVIAFNYFCKNLHLKPSRGVWICVGFKMYQGSEYSRIVNMPRVLNFHGNTGFTYFCKYDRVLSMRWDSIIEGFWIFQNFKYPRFLSEYVSVTQGLEYVRKWLNNARRNCSDNGKNLNMPGQGFIEFWTYLQF